MDSVFVFGCCQSLRSPFYFLGFFLSFRMLLMEVRVRNDSTINLLMEITNTKNEMLFISYFVLIFNAIVLGLRCQLKTYISAVGVDR